MTFHRGAVVLLDFPFSDGQGKKVRPALIVQGDRDNARMEATIVALITKNLSRVASEPSQLKIVRESPAGRDSGLLADSAVVGHHLFTVPQRKILRVIGQLPPMVMSQIDSCLSLALDLPQPEIGQSMETVSP
jgi:mRNA-degrading endonuclease toxin of MazEF toxin-antitoxin module